MEMITRPDISNTIENGENYLRGNIKNPMHLFQKYQQHIQTVNHVFRLISLSNGTTIKIRVGCMIKKLTFIFFIPKNAIRFKKLSN